MKSRKHKADFQYAQAIKAYPVPLMTIDEKSLKKSRILIENESYPKMTIKGNKAELSNLS